MDGVTFEGLRLPGLPACSGGDGNKEQLCAHMLTLTRTAHAPHKLFPRMALQAWLPR